MRLIGSVPTVTHLLEGTRDDVMEIAREMMEGGTDFLSPSCGLPQYTPLQNVQAIADAIEQWNGGGTAEDECEARRTV
jgi:uroporphyrinogen-III decarboxylase